MRISGRNTPGNDRWSWFGAPTKERFNEKRKQTIRRSLKQGIILPFARSASLPLLLLLLTPLLFLQGHWCFVLATSPMSSKVAAVSKRSLSFVAAKNSHRPFTLLPWPASSSSSSLLPTTPIIRMEIERRSMHHNNIRPNQQQHRLHASSSSKNNEAVDKSPTSLSSESKNYPRNNNEKLRSDLEQYRIEQSKSLGKSPSVILPDKVMDGICALDPLPSTIEDLSQVKGLGPKKLELFGNGILGLVAPKVTTAENVKTEVKGEGEATVVTASNFTLEFANATTTTNTTKINKISSATEDDGVNFDVVIEAASTSEVSSGKTTLRSSNSSSLSSSSPTTPIIRTGTEEKSRYSTQVGFNQSSSNQQQRSNSSSSTSIMKDSGNDTNKKGNDNETSTSSSIGKEETDNNLQPKEGHQRKNLRSDLEDYRMEQSKILGKSPSVILPNKVIDGICSLDPLPTTIEDLSKVKGMGAKKLKVSGETILGLVSSATQTIAKDAALNDVSMATESLKGGSISNIADGDNGIASALSSTTSSLDSVSAPDPSPAPLADNGCGDSIALPDEHIASSPQSTVPAEEIDNNFSLDSFVAPAPYSAPEGETGSDSFDSNVAPPPNSVVESVTGAAFDSYVAPAPYSAPKGSTGGGALDSFVAPAPYSFIDEDEEDDYEDDEISEESFGTASLKPTKDPKKEEPKEMTTTKLRKTELKKDLKEYRTSQLEDGKAAYTIFTNAALEGIYASLPVTKSELLDVKGIGPKKLELYGDDILALVAPYAGMGGQRDQGEASGDANTPIRREKIDPKSLTVEQRKAADMIFGKDQDEEDRRRRNVFVTGSAGTGKSHLLKYVVETLQGLQNEPGSDDIFIKKGRVVGVCAPTGVAAVIVGGSTLHSFFGIGLGTGSKSSLLRKVRQNTAAKTRIDETDVLIIDECSMLSSELLETLDMVAREIRRDGMFSDEPFGGMQVIAFGDFFQLPPVHRYDGNNNRNWRPFCFDSPVWSELGLSENIIELREVQRQEEGDFVTLLNKVRIGSVSESDIFDLNQKCLVGVNNPLPNDGILPTRLYVLNRDVDLENSTRLKELNGKEIVCSANDVWRQKMPLGTPASVKKKMKDGMSLQMPDEIRLKVGAQVMLTRNRDLEKNLVNGSRGVVERFETNRDGNPIPVVRFDSGIITRIDPVEFARHNMDGGEGCLVRRQVPLKLAWAITIHKSQGSTLTRASLDVASAFEYGQCYVALSRVRSLEGLWLERPAELRNVMVSPQVVDFFSKSY